MAEKKNFWRAAWRSKKKKKATATILGTDNQEALLEGALRTPSPAERRQVAAGISDERLLAELILSCEDGSLLSRIIRPELLLKLALNAGAEVSAAAFAKLCQILPPAELVAMLTVKVRSPNEKNMMAVLQMLKAIEPDRWKEHCDRKTIDTLLDLRYWRELPEIAVLLWDLYEDDAFREMIHQAEADYQSQMQQWEGEYNHILEMLFYQAEQKQNLQATRYIQAMYDDGIYWEYIEKRKTKTDACHIDEKF